MCMRGSVRACRERERVTPRIADCGNNSALVDSSRPRVPTDAAGAFSCFALVSSLSALWHQSFFLSRSMGQHRFACCSLAFCVSFVPGTAPDLALCCVCVWSHSVYAVATTTTTTTTSQRRKKKTPPFDKAKQIAKRQKDDPTRAFLQ